MEEPLLLLSAALAAVCLFLIIRLWQTQTALRKAGESACRFSLLWRQLPDIITEIDPQGRILEVNHLLDQYRREDVLGKMATDLLTAEQAQLFSHAMDEVLATLQPSYYDIHLTQDGHESWLRNTMLPVLQDGSLQALLVVSSDYTEVYRAREVLVQQKEDAEQASQSKSRFLASMSHEIRTPMTGLIGMVSLLEQTPLTSEQQGFLRVIQHSSEHLLTIVNDILDSSKIEAGMLEIDKGPFSIREMCDNLMNMMAARAREKGLALQCFVDEQVPAQVIGDPVRIRQILMNFLTNALKFTEQGHVLLRVALIRGGQDSVRLRFSVEDSGIGIRADQARYVFDEYRVAHGRLSTQAGGTGLGLSISQRLAKLMGGQVGVISAAGTGSCFWLDLQLAVADNLAAEPPPADVSDCQIWVLDEVQVNRSLVVSVAHSIPLRVREFADAGLLFRALEKEQPQLLIVADAIFRRQRDQLLPRCRGKVPLAVSSSGTAVANEKALRADGVRAFWDWPVSQEQLKRILLRLLTEPENRAQPAAELITRDSSAPPAATEPVSADALAGVRVLLAEDNEVNQKVALQMLKRLGCTATVAANGEEAVALYRDQSFDLVLMDCHMPVMDGLEATRRIRALQERPQVPVIALSADVMAEQKAACSAAGMDGYLTKPVRLEELRLSLLSYLQRPTDRGSDQSALP